MTSGRDVSITVKPIFGISDKKCLGCNWFHFTLNRNTKCCHCFANLWAKVQANHNCHEDGEGQKGLSQGVICCLLLLILLCVQGLVDTEGHPLHKRFNRETEKQSQVRPHGVNAEQSPVQPKLTFEMRLRKLEESMFCLSFHSLNRSQATSSSGHF